MKLTPSTPLWNVPAYGWIAVWLFCLFTAVSLGKPAELPPIDDIPLVVFKEPILMAKRGANLVIVPLKEEKPGDILWNIAPTQHEKPSVEFLFGWHDKRLYLGLWRMHTKWTFTLNRVRFIERPAREKVVIEEIPAADLVKVRSLVHEELNRRFPEEKMGDRFDHLLDAGIEETTLMCMQNFAIFAVWATLLPAILAAAKMVSKQPGAAQTQPACPAPGKGEELQPKS